MEKNDPRTWSYEDAIERFDEFCDYFDHAASIRYKDTQRNPSEVLGPDPRIADASGEFEETTVDVPPPELGGVYDDSELLERSRSAFERIRGEIEE